MGRVLDHLRSNVIAYLALFLVIGGGTVYAADRIKVGSKQVKRNAIKAKHIAENAVGESELNETDAGIIRTPLIKISDPNNGDTFTDGTLLKRGPFTITARCRDLGSTTSQVYIASSETAWGTGTLDTTDPDTIGPTPSQLSPGSGSLNNGGVNVHSAYFTTASGKFISVAIHQTNKPSGAADPDCVYLVTGSGN